MNRCLLAAVSLLALCMAATACECIAKPPPMSDAAPGLVPAGQFVHATDGGHATRSISVVLDQQPAGNRSLFAVSATEIVRPGTPDRFAQPNVACPNQLIGSCIVTNCTSLKDVISYPYGTVTPMPLGLLQVKSASRSETMSADGGLRPKVISAQTPLFAQGALVQIIAAAAGAPAFQRRLVVPRSVTLLSPALEESGTTLGLRRDEPFEVRWAALPAGAPERVAISVGDNVRVASCRFDATTGKALIPLEVLAMLAPGPGLLTVHTLWAHDEAADGWLVSVFARQVALQADGGTASFPTLDIE